MRWNFMNHYSSLLSELIDKSGLSLTEISIRAEKCGQKITTSYLSKLKNGKMPPPSFKMSIVLAQTLDVEPEVLILAGIKEQTEANKEELENTLDEIYPDKKEDVLQKINPPFSIDETTLLNERVLTPESLKEKYNLEIDGKPATNEEIEEMIKHIKLFRIMKQMENS
jgi:transcriptional regulator with XRE-family HTH domain